MEEVPKSLHEQCVAGSTAEPVGCCSRDNSRQLVDRRLGKRALRSGKCSNIDARSLRLLWSCLSTLLGFEMAPAVELRRFSPTRRFVRSKGGLLLRSRRPPLDSSHGSCDPSSLRNFLVAAPRIL